MSQLLQTVLRITVIIILLCYPFLIYFGLKWLGISSLALILMVLFSLRLLLLKANIKAEFWVMRLIGLIAIFLCGLSYFFKEQAWLLYYPVVVNLTLLLLFSYSLIYPPTIIERFARLQDPELPQEGINYTRKVTKIWCAFFVFNGLIAFWTAVGLEQKWWVLYNGAISYMLIGLLLAGEWIVRKRIITNH